MGDNCCCIDYLEPADVWNQRVIRSRKEHKCEECGDAIAKGKIYERTSMLFEGRWSTHITCARCANIRDEYFTCGCEMGNMVEDFRECFGFDYRDGIPPDFTPCKKGKTPTVEAAA